MAGKTLRERLALKWSKERDKAWMLVLDTLKESPRQAADLLKVIRDLDQELGQDDKATPTEGQTDLTSALDKLKSLDKPTNKP